MTAASSEVVAAQRACGLLRLVFTVDVARRRRRRPTAAGFLERRARTASCNARGLVCLDLIRYFAYRTTQEGFAHHRRFAGLLDEPVDRFRTMSAHAIVVPRRAACSDPGCPYIHRMAALVPGLEGLCAEGDLFLLPDEALAVIDQLETGSTGLAGQYVRALVPVV